MAEFVVDASALAKELKDEPRSAEFRAWHDGQLGAGAVLSSSEMLGYEMAQFGRRHGRYPEALLLVEGLVLHGAFADLGPFLDALSAYDASYLAVAARRSAPLVTYDDRMQVEARRHGIEVLAP